jgi:hypothetical protein
MITVPTAGVDDVDDVPAVQDGLARHHRRSSGVAEATQARVQIRQLVSGGVITSAKPGKFAVATDC